MASRRRPHVLYLYPAILFYSTTLFGCYLSRILVITAMYTERQCSSANLKDCTDDEADDVTKQAALVITYMGLATAVPQILVAPHMGALADWLGRRAPAMATLLGSMVANMCIVLILAFEASPYWIILGSFIEGSTGFYASFLMATSTYTADINAMEALEAAQAAEAAAAAAESHSRNAQDSATKSHSHTQRFAYLEAMLSLGNVAGPLLGAVCSAALRVDDGAAHFIGLFLGGTAILALVFFYLLFVVPETLPAARALSSASSAGRPDLLAEAASPFAPYDGVHGNDDDDDDEEDEEQQQQQQQRRQSQPPGGRASMLALVRMAMATRPLRSGGSSEDDGGDEATKATTMRSESTTGSTSADTTTTPQQVVRLAFVSTAFMLLFGSSNSAQSIFALYTQREWGWGAVQVNLYVSLIGAIGTFSLLFSRPLFSAVAGLCSRTTTELSDMAYVHTCADRSHVFAFLFQQ